MTPFSDPQMTRWEELQIAELLFGLSPEEQAEFETLNAQVNRESPSALEMVVGALDVAWSGASSEALPEHVLHSIKMRAGEILTPRRDPSLHVDEPILKSRSRTLRLLPWLISAACLLFAIRIYVHDQPVQISLAQKRENLIGSVKDIVRANWSPGTTPIPGATGDVVWSPSQRAGYMRFEGLPVNDPAREQYQLWIFDKEQNDKTPIDGGVFNISSQGEAIVPIDPKLQVQQAYLFAVTIEKPGGVVVSSRERLPLLAKIN